MTPDERTRDTMGRATDTMGRSTHPIDDDEVARLVHDVAAGWVMPPVRLDQPGWRERIRGARARRVAGLAGWLGRTGQAATAAVALTVVAAILAVFLTSRPTDVGKVHPTASPSAASNAPATSEPGPTALPKLFTAGDLPSPSRVVVQQDDGEFAVVDLSSGTVGSQLTASTYGSRIRRAPNGDLVCVCTSTDGIAFGQFTHLKVTLERFDASGVAASRDVVLDVTGAPDPRYEQVPEQPGHVAAWSSFSADGRYAYIGWSARAHPSWTSGLVVVALDDGRIVQRLDLPPTTDGTLDLGWFVDAPRVVGQAGDRVVINRPKYSWGPVTSVSAAYTPGSDAFAATVNAGGNLATPTPLAGAASCGDDVTLAGSLPNDGLWLACPHYGVGGVVTTIRRLGSDGSAAGDSAISSSFVEGSTSVVSPDGRWLYIWDPLALQLNRVDLATGETTKAKAPAPTSATDPLTALGRWLAPATFGKMFLQPGVALSPDGSRLYGIGVIGDPAAQEFSSAAGVVVFDTAAMTALGRWAPTADFSSIAVSADGSFVYAAGLPGVDASGMQTSQNASITVFNAGDGSIRLIAGQLGRQMLSFADANLK